MIPHSDCLCSQTSLTTNWFYFIFECLHINNLLINILQFDIHPKSAYSNTASVRKRENATIIKNCFSISLIHRMSKFPFRFWRTRPLRYSLSSYSLTLFYTLLFINLNITFLLFSCLVFIIRFTFSRVRVCFIVIR